MNAGRILLTGTALSTLFGPFFADFNETHVFNPEWPPHARFHSVVLLIFGMGMSAIALWLIWKRSPDRDTNMKVAALVPILAWGSFFLAILVPGTGVEDHPGDLLRIMGVPLNLVVAGTITTLSALGYVLYARSRRRPRPLMRRWGAT